jgi:PIN domain nuclease of toxin-antitoxin system
MKVVFNACTIIAFFRDEPGADIVESYIVGSEYDCMIHSVNLCEVYYDVYRSNGDSSIHHPARR